MVLLDELRWRLKQNHEQLSEKSEPHPYEGGGWKRWHHRLTLVCLRRDLSRPQSPGLTGAYNMQSVFFGDLDSSVFQRELMAGDVVQRPSHRGNPTEVVRARAPTGGDK